MFTAILKGISLYLPYPALGLLISAGLTYLAIFFLPRFGFVDIPGGRHQHEKPVPRGGGIAIVTAFFLTVFLFWVGLLDKNIALYTDIQLFLSKFWLPALIIFVIGVLDDRYELRSCFKLLFQIAVGVIFYLEGAGISKIYIYQIPAPLGLAVTICWSVVIINAFNLIDGLDGVAAGLAAIASFFLAAWTILIGGSPAMVVILLTFSACCLGFLRFNFSPARIFMGDTGSTFLGLFFAYISMQYSAKSVTLTALLVPLAAIGVPMFDVFLAIWRRFFRRYINKDSNSSIMQGDHDHLHHRILKETGIQRKTAWIIYALASGLCLLALIGVFLEESSSAMIFVLLLLTIFVMIRYASIELFDTLTCVRKGLQIP
ncbi:MAG: undecaprenyl/decaprenyl-phosphate alpha-N-acetylglucosaminyl 1-phosphate transferase, partial [Lentisphaeria bacterium]|nr:undecaprenyl/decaprenyl-phosphate alpha-N-acetylglucosaminyl 1-phosphate transferase [Lentisphaeria bacterium]